MKKSIFLFSMAFSFLYCSLEAQESMFIPREVRSAISKNTRSLKGAPGPAYWQNSIDYRIDAYFNPETGQISGKEIVVFTNKSPNSLYEVVFNLYPNLFKFGNKRDREVDPKDLSNGIEITKITIDGNGLSENEKRTRFEGTRMNIFLPKALLPGNEVEITLEWEFHLPSNTRIRIGKYGINTWFVGYWYPQIAVYDDIFGWDEIDYDGLHEFYSAYADFDVKLTCPANQIIWATGIWQNPEQILSDTYLKRYQQAINSDNVINILKNEDLSKKITKSDKENTWHFKAKNVSDFSFATSDQYLWDGVSVITDKKQNTKTFIQVAYNKFSRDFSEVADISKKTITYLSTVMPAIPFPYPRMTVFNGDDGMEFPMMVNDRSEISKSETVNLTSHEISHTYFPFYVGINQERFSWMDEGLAMFLPSEFQERSVLGNKQKASSAFNYVYSAGSGLEMPMMVPSFYLKGFEYYTASYYRPEIALRVLENLLGKDLFLNALQEYIRRWNGKYPGPYDFFFTFNDVTGQDLTWFWNPWYFEMAYPDLGISSVIKAEKEYIIQIENIGGLPLPVELNIEFSDKSRSSIFRTAEIWKSDNKQYQIKFESDKTISRVSFGSGWIPDSNTQNNEKYILK